MTMRTGGSPAGGGKAGPSAVGPDCPQNWYLVARSADLARGAILPVRLGNLDLVIYRGRQSGRAAAFTAHCAHAGCHLRHGDVIGDGLRCALHHRMIRHDGCFIAKDASPLPTRPQPTLPLVERFDCIFVFAGREALFDLPMPAIAAPGPVTTHPLPVQLFALPWSTLISNGMDIDHLQSVHDRALRAPPTLQRMDRYRMRLEYQSRVTGRQLSDRLMKWIANDDIHSSITCVGGSMMMVESRVGGRRTFVMLSMCPDGGGGTTIRSLVGVAGDPRRIVPRIAARVAAWLFHAFLKKDVGIVREMEWHEPETEVTLGDAITRELCAFFRSLPPFDGVDQPPVARAPLLATGRGA